MEYYGHSYIFSTQCSTLPSVLAGSRLQLRLLSTQSEAAASPQTESDYHSIIKDTEKGTGELAISCFSLDHVADVCIFPLMLLCGESDKTHHEKVNISCSCLCHRGATRCEMLIGVTVMTDVFWDVTMLFGRLLPSSGILKRKWWRQQVSPKIGNSGSYYSVVHPKEDSSYEECHLIY